MIDLNLIAPEIFISLSVMTLLMIGVFLKNSQRLVFNLSILTLVILLAVNINIFQLPNNSLFGDSYQIDKLSTFMKIIMIVSGIFVLISSSQYLNLEKIFKIEYPILVLSSMLGMMVMISSKNITKSGFNPIISGGAGLYYRALTKGIFDKSATNIDVRSKLENEYDSNPIIMYEKLKKIDPEYVKIVHINNKKRLVRALEIYQTTGISPSKHFENQKNQKIKPEKLSLFTIYLCLEREAHRRRIRSRALEMLDNGWIEETKSLIKMREENTRALPALNSIGYEQIINFLNRKINKETLLEIITNKTWQYARKQINWFKNEDIDLTINVTNLGSLSAANCISDLYSEMK